MPLKLGLYRHFKGNLYQVIAVARHSETLEIMVVYQALYGSYGIWVRPYDLFASELEYDGKTIQRFEFIGENTATPPQVI